MHTNAEALMNILKHEDKFAKWYLKAGRNSICHNQAAKVQGTPNEN